MKMLKIFGKEQTKLKLWQTISSYMLNPKILQSTRLPGKTQHPQPRSHKILSPNARNASSQQHVYFPPPASGYTHAPSLLRDCAPPLWLLITSAVRLHCDDVGAIVFTAPHLRPLVVPLCTAHGARRPVVQLNGFQFHPI